MKKLHFTISLLLFTIIICANVYALTCSIVDEYGNIITEAKPGDVVYLMDSYVNLKSGKLNWKLKTNLPTIDSKKYKVSINDSGYYYHEGSSEERNNYVPFVIPARDYIKGTAKINYNLTKAGKCTVTLYISESIPSTNPYMIISATAGANGTITPSGMVTVPYGQNYTFMITPNTGYHIADVIVDGTSVGAVNSYTFAVVILNHTIVATFAIDDCICPSISQNER